MNSVCQTGSGKLITLDYTLIIGLEVRTYKGTVRYGTVHYRTVRYRFGYLTLTYNTRLVGAYHAGTLR